MKQRVAASIDSGAAAAAAAAAARRTSFLLHRNPNPRSEEEGEDEGLDGRKEGRSKYQINFPYRGTKAG